MLFLAKFVLTEFEVNLLHYVVTMGLILSIIIFSGLLVGIIGSFFNKK